MHFNLEEQEQLAEFKAWWKRFGKWILATIVAVSVGYISYATYGWWNKKSSLGASKVYELVLTGAQKQDIPLILKATADLQDQFQSTSYAGMASLVAAQVTNAAGDLANSEKNLRWAVDKAKVDAHQDIARARLVSLLIDQDKFDEARKVAAASVSKPFEPLILERRGDVEFAQQKNADARKFYQQGWDLLLKNADASDESKRLLKVKLDAVGGRS
jgi:predicted negative regulator of RcsB-dependent stress response